MEKKNKIRKVKPLNNIDVYYTKSDWKEKIIDGTVFINVVKKDPNLHKEEQKMFLMCKENLEFLN